jgi:hypothetical protein
VNPLLLQGNADFRRILARHFKREDRAISRGTTAIAVASMGMVMADTMSANPYAPTNGGQYVAALDRAQGRLTSDLAEIRAKVLPSLLSSNVAAMRTRYDAVQSEIEARANGTIESFVYPAEYFSTLPGSELSFAVEHAILTIFSTARVSAAGRTFSRNGTDLPGFAITGTTEDYRSGVRQLLARLPWATYVGDPGGLEDRGRLTVTGKTFELVREATAPDARVPVFAQSVEQLVTEALDMQPVLEARQDAADRSQAIGGLQKRISDLKEKRRNGGSRDSIDRKIRSLRTQITELGRG